MNIKESLLQAQKEGIGTEDKCVLLVISLLHFIMTQTFTEIGVLLQRAKKERPGVTEPWRKSHTCYKVSHT